MSQLGKRKRNAFDASKAANHHTPGNPLIEDMDHSDQSSSTSNIFSPPIRPVASDVSTNPTDPMSLDIEDSDSDISSSSEEPSDISSDSDSDPDGEDTEMGTSPSTFADAPSDDPAILNLRVGAKPTMRLRPTHTAPATDLLAKVRSFMPQMQAANEQLEREREDGTLNQRKIEVDDEDPAREESEGAENHETECENRNPPARGPIIEMNLGLGVLEEQKHSLDGVALPDYNREGSESYQSDSDCDSDDQSQPEDVFSKLLGRKQPGTKTPTISVVSEGKD